MNDELNGTAARLQSRHFLSSADMTSSELAMVLDTAVRLKADLKAGRTHHLLSGRSLALVFEKPSLRTRLSFDIGMYQLGGGRFI